MLQVELEMDMSVPLQQAPQSCFQYNISQREINIPFLFPTPSPVLFIIYATLSRANAQLKAAYN